LSNKYSITEREALKAANLADATVNMELINRTQAVVYEGFAGSDSTETYDQISSYVVDGAVLKCKCGSKPCQLDIEDSDQKIMNRLQAHVKHCDTDLIKMGLFGTCAIKEEFASDKPVLKLPSQNDILTVCMPRITDKKWKKGHDSVLVGDEPALLTKSTIHCNVGGTIHVKDCGQEYLGTFMDLFQHGKLAIDENGESIKYTFNWSTDRAASLYNAFIMTGIVSEDEMLHFLTNAVCEANGGFIEDGGVTEPSGGALFKGGGVFQITHNYNYRDFIAWLQDTMGVGKNDATLTAIREAATYSCENGNEDINNIGDSINPSEYIGKYYPDYAGTWVWLYLHGENGIYDNTPHNIYIDYVDADIDEIMESMKDNPDLLDEYINNKKYEESLFKEDQLKEILLKEHISRKISKSINGYVYDDPSRARRTHRYNTYIALEKLFNEYKAQNNNFSAPHIWYT